jgi:hypothetical protein
LGREASGCGNWRRASAIVVLAVNRCAGVTRDLTAPRADGLSRPAARQPDTG